MVTLSAYSDRFSKWFRLDNVVADTGADFTVLPYSVGLLLLPNPGKARATRLRGIVPGQSVDVFLNSFLLRLGPRSFTTLVGVAKVDGVPAILGRHKALDLFTAVYRKGRSLVLEW